MQKLQMFFALWVILIGTTACGSIPPRPNSSSGGTTPPTPVEMVVPTETPESAAPVSVDHKNIAYEIDGTKVQLVNGLSEVEAAPGSASKIVTSYFGQDAFGDLNNDGEEDVVFLLTQTSGGSGTFYYVVAAWRTAEGYSGSKAVLLGDRIVPISTSIADGKIVVNYADRNPGEDFSVEPSLGMTKHLILQEGSLQETVLPAQIKQRSWKWVRTQMNDGSIFTPTQPEAFTIVLGQDGQVTGTTDCNNFFGSYTLQDPLLSFGDFASTKMFCEGSQEAEFLKYLAEVQSYLIVDNQLVLEIKFDSGQIIFE